MKTTIVILTIIALGTTVYSVAFNSYQSRVVPRNISQSNQSVSILDAHFPAISTTEISLH